MIDSTLVAVSTVRAGEHLIMTSMTIIIILAHGNEAIKMELNGDFTLNLTVLGLCDAESSAPAQLVRLAGVPL